MSRNHRDARVLSRRTSPNTLNGTVGGYFNLRAVEFTPSETLILSRVSIFHLIPPYIVLPCFAYFFSSLSFYISCIDGLAASLNLLQR